MKIAETKNKIIELLKQKGNYEEVDDILIDQLIYNIQVINKAKKGIRDFGISQNVRAEGQPLYQATPFYSTYLQAMKLVLTILTKLSITAQERIKLGLLKEENSELDEI